MGAPFKLKSGNSPLYKTLGSSPTKHRKISPSGALKEEAQKHNVLKATPDHHGPPHGDWDDDSKEAIRSIAKQKQGNIKRTINRDCLQCSKRISGSSKEEVDAALAAHISAHHGKGAAPKQLRGAGKKFTSHDADL
jgi:hypothetical protein